MNGACLSNKIHWIPKNSQIFISAPENSHPKHLFSVIQKWIKHQIRVNFQRILCRIWRVEKRKREKEITISRKVFPKWTINSSLSVLNFKKDFTWDFFRDRLVCLWGVNWENLIIAYIFEWNYNADYIEMKYKEERFGMPNRKIYYSKKEGTALQLASHFPLQINFGTL